MKIEILSEKFDIEFVNLFIKTIQGIDPIIAKMVEDKGVSFVLANSLYDVRPKEEMAQNYEKFYEDKYTQVLTNKYPARGVTSDVRNCIAVFYENTQIEHLEAILYHEIGHFIDSYENFGKIDSLDYMTFSTSESFMQAYKNDLTKNWDLIKNDDNFRLKHFVQNSTPENIHAAAVVETFSEIYRWKCGKINDTKTVELYFHESAKAAEKLLFDKYEIKNKFVVAG